METKPDEIKEILEGIESLKELLSNVQLPESMIPDPYSHPEYGDECPTCHQSL